MFSEVRYAVAGHVATITMDRPERLNAVTNQMIDELLAAFDRAETDDDVRAIVLTGAGRAFCAGMDLGPDQGGGQAEGDPFRSPDRRNHRDRAGDVAVRIYECTRPVIAAINGAAVGMGATMILPADVRLASSTAKIGYVFTRRGLTPEGASTWFLPRVVGVSQALEWFATGRVFGADEALAAGLVRSVHPPAELLAAAHALAAEIAEQTASVCVALTRQMVWRGLSAGHPRDAQAVESRALGQMGAAADAREGFESFLEKRPPRFTGRLSTDLPDFYPWWPPRGFEPMP